MALLPARQVRTSQFSLAKWRDFAVTRYQPQRKGARLTWYSLELTALSLQDAAAPDGVCYGCGSRNPHGLHVKSRWHEDGIHVVAEHLPDPMHCGWPELVYGGLIAMLVDCHSNWTAMAYHYRAEGREPGSLPRIDCVTGNLGIKFIKPTPMGVSLQLRARIEGDVGRKTRVICEVYAGELLTAVGDSIFVRVDTSQLAATAHGREA